MKVFSNRNFPNPNICQKYSVFYFELIIFLIKIVFSNLVIKKIYNYYSEIHLVIKGSGEQKLLNDYFNSIPSEVYVNGIKKELCKKECNLEGQESNVTLRFENQLTSCSSMFNGLKDIIEIDLSDFDASQVKNMQAMLNDCSNLKKNKFWKYKYFFS